MRPAASYKAMLAEIAQQAAEALAEGNGEIFARQTLARLRFVVRPAADAFVGDECRCHGCGVYVSRPDAKCPECGTAA